MQKFQNQQEKTPIDKKWAKYKKSQMKTPEWQICEDRH